MPMITLAAEAAADSASEVSAAEMFFPTPFGIDPLLFILMLLVAGTALIATIITLRLRRKRGAKRAAHAG